MSQATAIFEKLPFAPTLSDQVAQALFARIESGQLKPGEKLPSEVVLAAEFGVSRSVVRDAISRLKLAEIEGAFAAASHMFNAARRIAATEFPSSEVFYFTLQFPCQAPAPYSFTQNQP
jgi:GntR family transcriptional regulator, transcriptional repressor for pyruvate dehydrogenase complex